MMGMKNRGPQLTPAPQSTQVEYNNRVAAIVEVINQANRGLSTDIFRSPDTTNQLKGKKIRMPLPGLIKFPVRAIKILFGFAVNSAEGLYPVENQDPNLKALNCRFKRRNVSKGSTNAPRFSRRSFLSLLFFEYSSFARKIAPARMGDRMASSGLAKTTMPIDTPAPNATLAPCFFTWSNK
jgi:hypothetical protein